MLARRTGRRRINEALAVVSPLAFADAVEAYVTSLEKDEVRALVHRCAKRMDSSERMQFALFLGHDTSGSGLPEFFSGPTMRAEELQRLVDGCDDFLPNRLAAFLRENPRAVPALGDDAVNTILATLPLVPTGPRALTGGVRARPLPAKMLLIVCAAILIALVPLVAQYIRQNGVIAGTANPIMLPMAAPPRIPSRSAKTLHVAAIRPSRVHHAAAAPVRMHLVAPKHVVALAPPRHVNVTPKRHAPRILRVAKNWKFDPHVNPYVARARSAHARAVAANAAAGAAMSPFEARARLVVNSYLGAVIAGDTPRALAHLGLPSGSDPKAISESVIVTRDTKAQIVAVKPDADGTTHVQVDLIGRRGEYFEVFSVAPDGPAVRIRDRFYIPVNRTAEEISARLLARTPPQH
jgi:hypothetical protein